MNDLSGAEVPVRVLAFDVFGTVVDWYTSVADEVRSRGLPVDAGEFALAWRAGYKPGMQRVARGERPWTRLDELHREILEQVLDDFGVRTLGEADKDALNTVWHRLEPWPDTVDGLARLRNRYALCTLSNGDVDLLTDMAEHAGLPWDRVLSAETFGHYKPAPETYLGAAESFGVRPDEVMMVAAHQEDLTAARACGLNTAYVERPREYGPTAAKDVSADPANTVHARDLRHLATVLGC